MAANHRVRTAVMERITVCPKCGAENLSWHSRCEACGVKLHDDGRAMPAFQGRGVGFWVALGLGVLATGVFAFAAVLAAGFLYEYRYLPYTALLSLAGILLCWKWPRAAGLELAGAGLLQFVFAFWEGDGDSVVFWVLMNAAIIASGVLFYRAGRRMHKDRAT